MDSDVTEEKPPEIPLACDMTALDATQRERHRTLLQEIHGAIVGTRELETGYILRFSPDSLTILRLAEFVDLERRCCPFLTFDVKLRAGGALSLRLNGPEGTPEFLRAELDIASEHRPPRGGGRHRRAG